jgi:hypothetical protein
MIFKFILSLAFSSRNAARTNFGSPFSKDYRILNECDSTGCPSESVTIQKAIGERG